MFRSAGGGEVPERRLQRRLAGIFGLAAACFPALPPLREDVKRSVKQLKTRALLGFCKPLICLAKLGVFIRGVTKSVIRGVTNLYP